MAIIYGSCTGTSGSKYNIWISWSVLSQSSANNTSLVSSVMWIQRNDGYAASAYTTDPTSCYQYLRYDGANEDGVYSALDTRNNSQVLMHYKDFTIQHNSDGTKTVNLSGGFTLSGLTSLTGGSVSGYVSLPTIPREATITSATTHTVESSLSYSLLNPANYYVKLVYQIYNGSTYTTIQTSNRGTGTSGTLTFSTAENNAMYGCMPSNTNRANKLIAYTYSDSGYSTLIGSAKEVIGTTYINQDICKPTVTATVVDSNATTVALTNDSAKLVKFYSNAQFAVTATPIKGAGSITNYSIVCGAKTATTATGTLTAVESGTFDIIATDSRGLKNINQVATVTKTLVDYVKLTLNPTFYRPAPTTGEIRLTYTGAYYNSTFGTGGDANPLLLKYRFRVKAGAFVVPTMTIANPCVVTYTAHALANGTGVIFNTTGALPTGITANTIYYARSVDANTLNLYTTSAYAIAGGTTGRITTSGSQSGVHSVYLALTPTLATASYSNGASPLSLGTGFIYTNDYDFEIVVKDELMTYTYTPTVTKGLPILYWDNDEVGVNGALKLKDGSDLSLRGNCGVFAKTNSQSMNASTSTIVVFNSTVSVDNACFELQGDGRIKIMKDITRVLVTINMRMTKGLVYVNSTTTSSGFNATCDVNGYLATGSGVLVVAQDAYISVAAYLFENGTIEGYDRNWGGLNITVLK